jgi:hypothetical protein
MIDERFSASAFEQLGRNSTASQLLLAELEKEIDSEMHDVVHTAFKRIADRLNELGHKLEPDKVESLDPRSYDYRDLGANESNRDHKLRIHFTYVISSGYPHYSDAE